MNWSVTWGRPGWEDSITDIIMEKTMILQAAILIRIIRRHAIYTRTVRLAIWT